MSENNVPDGKSYEDIGGFWDNHDFADFDDPNAPDIQFEVVCAIPIDKELFRAIEIEAHKRGVQTETLVNLWLQQKLSEQS